MGPNWICSVSLAVLCAGRWVGAAFLNLGVWPEAALAVPAAGTASGGTALAGQKPDTPDQTIASQDPLGPIAAWVAQEPISKAEVDRLVRQTVGTQALSPLAQAVLQAQALEELIAQRVVLLEAERNGQAPSPAQIDAALSKLEKNLSQQNRSLQEYLQTEKITLALLRRQLAWDLYWPKRLAQEMTFDRLQAHFQAHRREYDGTELLISHILFPYPPADKRPPEQSAEATSRPDWKQMQARLLAEAEQVRQEILSGRIGFAEAARRYSQSPTASEGGRIGWIARHGVMVESFAKAAFALPEGQVSPPVLTPFGVHLIRCDAVRPGTKPFDQVLPEVQRGFACQILQTAAAAGRRYTPVRYSGLTPYWHPQTGQLVLP